MQARWTRGVFLVVLAAATASPSSLACGSGDEAPQNGAGLAGSGGAGGIADSGSGGGAGTSGTPVTDASASGGAPPLDAATAKDGNPACVGLCGSAQYCCTDRCPACVPTADRCSAVVCGPDDGGDYVSYPGDCVAAYSGDSTFCGVPATSPHSIHFYQCTTSLLASPCRPVSIGTKGGTYCCPGRSY